MEERKVREISESGRVGFCHQPNYSVPVLPWAGCFTYSILSFFICKMGFLGLSDHVQKYLAAGLVHNRL